MPDVERLESMLFNYQTTYKTDYHRGEVTPPTFTTYKEKPKRQKSKYVPIKDTHTLTHWSTRVPFSLMHIPPKPILRTDPTKIQELYVKPPDTEKAEIIKTRPRLVMTPAVSMDDVTDPRARAILCDQMYTSNAMRAARDVPTNYFTVKAPLPGLPAPANPTKLPPLQLPYVSPEWRMQSISWDTKQLRGHVDPSKEFWLRQKLPTCVACKETEIAEADRKLRYQNLMKTRRR